MNETFKNELRRLPLFQNLREDELACLEDGTERTLTAGEFLVKEGDASEFFTVLLEGELKVTRIYGKQEIALATHQLPGTFTGEIALLLDLPSLASIRAVKPSRWDCA